jgi:arginine/lysine/ornithine decarboxylase
VDHRRAPILDALEAYHAADFASFCIPAHKQGRGLDDDTRRVLGAAPFRDDVLLHKGLDDRTGSHGVLEAAQELTADAFGADQSFFSTNGSTLAVQAAVIAGARVAVEGVDYRHLMFIVTIGDDDLSGDRLVAAVHDLAAMAGEQGRPPLAPMAFTEALFRGAEYPLRPRDAFLGPTRHAKLGDAAGEIAAEPVSPYPPGVPVVVPGQRITAEIVDFLRAGMEAGMYVEGASDPSLEVIRVADGR